MENDHECLLWIIFRVDCHHQSFGTLYLCAVLLIAEPDCVLPFIHSFTHFTHSIVVVVVVVHNVCICCTAELNVS